MNCLACDRGLSEMTVGDITVDVCKGDCGGVWFDNFELQKFDESHEAQGEALLDIELDETIQVDHEVLPQSVAVSTSLSPTNKVAYSMFATLQNC